MFVHYLLTTFVYQVFCCLRKCWNERKLRQTKMQCGFWSWNVVKLCSVILFLFFFLSLFINLFWIFLDSFSVVSYFFSFFPSLFQYLSFYSNVSFFLSLFLFLCHFFRFFLSDSRPWRVGSLTSMSPFQKKYHFWKWSNLWN